MNRPTPYEAFKKHAVRAESLSDFLTRYTKSNAPFGALDANRINEFADELERNGFCFIPKALSVTGGICAYYKEELKCQQDV